MRSLPRSLAALGLAALLACIGATAASGATAHGSTAHGSTARGWTATWTAAPQRPSASFAPNWSEQGFANQTVRQIVRVSTGGAAIRVRLSNAYGATPLEVAGATVARTASGAAVQPGSLRRLTVHGARTFAIPAGAGLASDPVPLPLSHVDSATVTLYLVAPTGPATYHAISSATSFRAVGDHVADTGATSFTETSQSWYYLSGVDTFTTARHRAGVVAFGDSITDGTGSSIDTNSRYPDALAERLAALGRPRPVLNQGIAGNRVTVDSAWFGDRAASRFRRDVLDQPGIGTVIVLGGINDLGISELAAAPPLPIFAPYPDVSVQQLIAGHRDMIRRAHARQLRVIGATLLPVKGSAYYTAHSEAKRDQVNTWIRTSGEYDAVVDLDRALAAPSDEDQLNPAYDSGDHLHPNDAGYRAMADAIHPADLG
ncbi:SGNH/GDSL hydrolase family protein [Actinomycetes bacterium KLBMP 9797]